MLVWNSIGSLLGDTAIIETSMYFESSSNCVFNYWYNTNGQSGTKINLLLKTKQGQFINLNTITSAKISTWQKASVIVGAYHSFSFALEVVFPPGSAQPVVAIDDISYSKCAPS